MGNETVFQGTPTAGAVLSRDGLYRYRLWRTWDGDVLHRQRMTFIMLNPSTADGFTDDMTVTKCIGFADRNGCRAIDIVNLFAYRATQPSELFDVDDPVGPLNKAYLIDRISHALGPIVAAWGGTKRPLRLNPEAYAEEAGRQILCLGRTKSGDPRHPSRLAYDTPMELFQ